MSNWSRAAFAQATKALALALALGFVLTFSAPTHADSMKATAAYTVLDTKQSYKTANQACAAAIKSFMKRAPSKAPEDLRPGGWVVCFWKADSGDDDSNFNWVSHDLACPANASIKSNSDEECECEGVITRRRAAA